MKSRAIPGCLGVLCFATFSLGAPTQHDTTVPNRFEFTQAEYVVAEDATHAVITVLFFPGNRGMTGSVGYTTENGTAMAGEDYVHTEGGLYFSGPAPLSFSVPVIWDALDEDDQTVQLRLGGSQPSTAVLRIANVPAPARSPLQPGAARPPAMKPRPPVVTLNIVEPSGVEGEDRAGVLLVRRSHGIENALRVYYRVTGGARNGADYERLPGSVVIPAGSHEAIIEIIPLDDALQERTERAAVHLKPAPGAARKYRLGAPHRRVIEILDND